MEAEDGKLWIGMFRGGLDVYDPKTQKYRNFSSSTANDISSFSNIWSIVERQNGEIWIGTLGAGICVTDSKLSPSKRLLSNPQDKSSLIDDIVMIIYVVSDEFVWVGTISGGLS